MNCPEIARLIALWVPVEDLGALLLTNSIFSRCLSEKDKLSKLDYLEETIGIRKRRVEGGFCDNRLIRKCYLWKGVLHGPYEVWVEDRLQEKMHYHLGRLHGKSTFIGDEGVLLNLETYYHGIKWGPYKEVFFEAPYYLIREGYYRNGLMEGLWSDRTISKVLSHNPPLEKVYYRKGKRHGECVIQDGNREERYTYLKGKKNGKASLRVDGKIVQEIEYRDDKVVERQEWNEDGSRRVVAVMGEVVYYPGGEVKETRARGKVISYYENGEVKSIGDKRGIFSQGSYRETK